MLVLLVDDNVDAVEAWAHFLGAVALSGEIEVDGEQAFEKARSVLPERCRLRERLRSAALRVGASCFNGRFA